MNTLRIASALLILAFASTAVAQQKGGKKLYCWDQGGQRVCGDALPPGATDLARTEISAKSGHTTGTVQRALTTAERAAAASAQAQATVAATDEAIRKRRDMAMVESYATEADLRRAYGERIALLDDALPTERPSPHLVGQLGSPERALAVVWAPRFGTSHQLGSPERALAVVWAPRFGMGGSSPASGHAANPGAHSAPWRSCGLPGSGCGRFGVWSVRGVVGSGCGRVGLWAG